MPKAGSDYSSKKFKNLRAAYDGYQKDRLRETANPVLVPRKKFANVWGWGKTPGSRARATLVK